MEHMKLLRNQSHTEKQLKAFEHDLSEMKKLKVKACTCMLHKSNITALKGFLLFWLNTAKTP